MARLLVGASKQELFKTACKEGDEEKVRNLFSDVDQQTRELGLGIAINENDSPLIKFLFQVGVNPNINDSTGMPILLKMAENGNTAIIKLYFKRGGNLKITDSKGWNALHFSASFGHLTTSRSLFFLGVDVKEKDVNGQTPCQIAQTSNRHLIFHFLSYVEKISSTHPKLLSNPKEINPRFIKSCEDGKLEIAKVLLPLIDFQTKKACLRSAVFRNVTPIIKFLLEEGKLNPNIDDSDGMPILLRMVEKGNKEMIELYQKKGGKINVVDHVHIENALHWSVWYGHLETTKYLISIGVDHKAKDIRGRTPLDLARLKPSKQIIEFLTDIEQFGKDGSNFMDACKNKQPKKAKHFIKNLDEATLLKCLENAILSNQTLVVRCVFEEGVNPNVLCRGFPVLFDLISWGNIEMIKLYHEKGGNVKVIDKKKWNALHWSAHYGNLEATKFFVSVGVDYKAKDQRGKKPIDLVDQRERMEIIQFLKEVEIQCTSFKDACKDDDYFTVMKLFKGINHFTREEGLGIAVVGNRSSIIKFLLEEGVNPNINDPSGLPILLGLALNGNLELIELYLKKGGNLNVTQQNWNALHFSCRYGHLETSKFLISQGIDYNAKDSNGKTPIDFANLTSKTELAHYLKHIVENIQRKESSIKSESKESKENLKLEENSPPEIIQQNPKDELKIKETNLEKQEQIIEHSNGLKNEEEDTKSQLKDDYKQNIKSFDTSESIENETPISIEESSTKNEKETFTFGNPEETPEKKSIKVASKSNSEIQSIQENSTERKLSATTKERDELKSKLEEEIKNSEQQLLKAQSENLKLQNQFILKSTEKNNLLLNRIQTETTLAQLKNQKVELEIEKKFLESQLKDSQESTTKLRNEKSNLMERIVALEKEKEILVENKNESEIESLRKRLEKSQNEIDELRQKVKKLEWDIGVLEKQNNELKEKIAQNALVAKIQELQSTILELHNINKSLNSKIMKLEEESKSNKFPLQNKSEVDFVSHLATPQSEITKERRLGSGAFGEVWQGVWKGMSVAIKKMSKSGMSESFKKEANLMFRLKHPHIVSLLGFVDEGEYCIIMEFVEKGNLSDFLKSKQKNELDWNLRRQFTLQIAQGMAYLHDEGILHRDLKSLNILLTKHLDAKIADFGLASLKKDNELNSSSPSSHGAFGTIAWMAPELLNGGKNSKESDVYSFGIVCWEIATHQLPWIGKPPMQLFLLLSKVEREEIPLETPRKFKKLIEMCWIQNPKVRPSFHQIIHQIERINFLTPELNPMQVETIPTTCNKNENEQKPLPPSIPKVKPIPPPRNPIKTETVAHNSNNGNNNENKPLPTPKPKPSELTINKNENKPSPMQKTNPKR